MATNHPALGSVELRQLRIDCGLSVPEASAAIGVNRATWWRWEEKGIEVPEGKIKAILALRGKPQPDASVSTTSVQVPIYSLQASAGELGASVTGHIGLERDYIRGVLMAEPSGLAAITIDGSMEPTIRSGEIVLMSKSQPGASAGDGIYLIRMDGAIMCKRLGRLPGNKLSVASDNPASSVYEVNLQDPDINFEILGRVVAVLRRL